jgi:ribosomal protein S18 acetylase RimI-like enzyme
VKKIDRELEYRYLRLDDYDQMIQVWQQAELSHRPKGRDCRVRITAELLRFPGFSLGAFAAEQLMGTIIGSFDGRKGCINRVAVIPEFRGQGIAQGLIDLCEKERKLANSMVLFCLIEEANERSAKLFEKLGYLQDNDIVYFSKRDHPDL